MSNPLLELSQSISQAAHVASQFVVAVSSRRKGVQSGILLDRNRILTIDHGVELEEDLKVLLPTGEVAAASLLGRDPGSDLALLQIENPYENAPSLHFAEAANLGEVVLNVSLSPETGPNVCLGTIGAVSGSWRTWKGGKLDAFIRLEAGGPAGVAVRADGVILGLATDGLVRGASIVIPNSNMARFVQAMESDGAFPRGYLGLGLQPIPRPSGMIVISVEDDSPSSAANLMVGDVILSIGGFAAADLATIQEFLEPGHVGEEVPLRILRAGHEMELRVEIGSRPAVRRVA